jgi:hypothetical protein
MLDGLRRLVGNPAATGGEGLLVGPDRRIVQRSSLDSGFDAADRAALQGYVRDGAVAGDPFAHALARVPDRLVTRTRSQAVPDAVYNRSAVVDGYVRRGNVGYRLMSFHRTAGGRGINVIHLHRAPGDRDFSARAALARRRRIPAHDLLPLRTVGLDLLGRDVVERRVGLNPLQPGHPARRRVHADPVSAFEQDGLSSVSFGRAASYAPVIDLLEGYFKLRDGDLEPLQRRSRTIEAVKRLLLREGRVQPLLEALRVPERRSGPWMSGASPHHAARGPERMKPESADFTDGGPLARLSCRTA